MLKNSKKCPKPSKNDLKTNRPKKCKIKISYILTYVVEKRFTLEKHSHDLIPKKDAKIINIQVLLKSIIIFKCKNISCTPFIQYFKFKTRYTFFSFKIVIVNILKWRLQQILPTPKLKLTT